MIAARAGSSDTTVVSSANHGVQFSIPSNAVAHRRRDDELARRHDSCDVDVVGAALIVDAEARDALDFVAPPLDTHGRIARCIEYVEDRSAPRELAAVLAQGLAAVSPFDERRHQRFGIDDVAASHDDRCHVGDTGCKSLHDRTARTHDDARCATVA
jgi:hypothetical protein